MTYYRILVAGGHVACLPSCADRGRQCIATAANRAVACPSQRRSFASKFEDAVTYECHSVYSFDGALDTTNPPQLNIVKAERRKNRFGSNNLHCPPVRRQHLARSVANVRLLSRDTSVPMKPCPEGFMCGLGLLASWSCGDRNCHTVERRLWSRAVFVVT